MLRFTGVFFAILLLLFGVEMINTVQERFILPFTAAIASVSAAIVTFFDTNVFAIGNRLYHSVTGFSVSIEPGCNGVEATIILIAAILAFRSTLKQKITGILAGFIAIQVLNLARVISLFYLGQWKTDVFTFAHLYLWPVLIMLDVLLVLVVWLKYIAHPEPGETPAAI